MNTTEGNRIIAKFMDSDSLPMRYDYDYNWLMPVVEHIESLGYYNTIEKIVHRKDDVHRSWFYKKTSVGLLRIASAEHEDKRTAVWLAVVAFIQWYNEKK